MTVCEAFADFHIHIGRALGRPVKMAAAASLTLERVMEHALVEKGLDIITVIDGVCDNVWQEVAAAVDTGWLKPVEGGGYLYRDRLLVLLGAEVEVAGPVRGAAHFGCWFPDLERAIAFQSWLKTVQKNTSLSSQRARCSAVQLERQTHALDGLFIVHHAFTPHKGLYGSCVRRMSEMVALDTIDALELGLSADTDMADCLSELAQVTFLSNSDAHSLPKIAREYNRLVVERLSFDEVRLALRREAGRKVVQNFGLVPALGKYHRTTCARCGAVWDVLQDTCACGSVKTVPGVFDRLCDVRDLTEAVHPPHRPPYIHQVPLEFIPGLGPKMRERLLNHFGTEMSVLHHVTVEQLELVVGDVLARRIEESRSGRIQIQTGGGGTYGKIQVEK
jgi:uncharacterized protein (TIGR00375 family)